MQLTDSFEMAEDIVQDFFIYFWEKKYYLKINQNLRYYLYLSVRHAAINTLQKNNMLSMEELSGLDNTEKRNSQGLEALGISHLFVLSRDAGVAEDDGKIPLENLSLIHI